MRIRTSRLFAIFTASSLLSLAACGTGNDGKGPKGPPEVGFAILKATSVPLVTELPGRTSAFLTAEVRPQITGVIQRRLFTEGALVRQGQPLYQIDSSLYRAAAGQAEANLAAAQASAASAAAKAERYKPLAAEKAVSQQDYTDAAALARTTAAQVAQTRAALQTAQVNLRFTTVPAPVTGRIGRSLLTEGALATSGQASPLAVISVLDPLYVDIQQSASEVLRLRRAGQNGQLASHVDVKLILDDGSEYPLPGSLEFSEVTVNPGTGTVTLRARFPNPDNLLLPGMFVRARLARGNEDHVWLVPQGAVSRDPRGNATVFLVGPGDKAVMRPVTAERTVGADWVVTAGLRDGDRLITQGLGKVKPNQPVRPVPDTKPERPRGPAKKG